MKRAPGLPSGKLGMGLAVVDVGDNGKVADMGLFKHVWFPPWGDVSDDLCLLYRIFRQNAICRFVKHIGQRTLLERASGGAS